VAEESKETPTRKLLWYVVGSVVAIVVGATSAWLTGILNPPGVKISVWEFFGDPDKPTYDTNGKSHVRTADVRIKNTWSKTLNNVEVRVSISPRDVSGARARELPWVRFDPKCQGVKPSPEDVGFSVTMRCQFLAPNEEVGLLIGFSVNRISRLEINVRSPEREQTVERSFDR
jgi:hypothetical protein